MDLYAFTVFLVTTIGTTFAECEGPTIAGCSIVSGVANCSIPDIPPVVKQLPPCLHSLYIYPTDTHNNFQYTDFTNLTNLQELVIEATHDQKDAHLVLPSLAGLESLLILKVKYQVTHEYAYTMQTFAPLKSVRVLDFSRTRRLNLTLFVDSMAILKQLPVEKLILRKVQFMNNRGYPYTEQLHFSDLFCPLGKSLEHIDVSFNDFTAILARSNDIGCMEKLKYIDFRYNLINDIEMVGMGSSDLVMLATFLGTIEEAYIGYQWYINQDSTKALWNDDKTVVSDIVDKVSVHTSSANEIVRYENNKINNTKLYAFEDQDIRSNFPNIPVNILTLFSQYKPWFLYIYNECFKNLTISFTQIAKCAPEFKDAGVCAVLDCFPELSQYYNGCCAAQDDPFDFIIDNVISQLCPFGNCKYGVPLPIPLKLRVLEYSNIVYFRGSMGSFSNNDSVAYCVFEQNQLQVMDLSNLSGDLDTSDFPNLRVTGLKNLTALYLQNVNFPSFNKRFFEDFPKLKILNIAGNQLINISTVRYDIFANNPHLEYLNMSNGGLKTIQPGLFSELHKLTTLDLSSNSIQLHNLTLTLQGTNISNLYLEHNELAGLSVQMMKQLTDLAPISVNLNRNPLICGCDNIPFIKWLQTSTSINFRSSSQYTCSEASLATISIMNVNIKELSWQCDTLKYYKIGIGSGLGFIVLVVFIIVLVKRQWHIKHWWFDVKNRFRATHAEPGQQINYKYDVFILYSSEDEAFAENVLADRLEEEFRLKVCYHSRDFKIGQTIMWNIEHAIENSRKIIAVISPNFVKSKYCQAELLMTYPIFEEKLCVLLYKDPYKRHVSRYDILEQEARENGSRNESSSEVNADHGVLGNSTDNEVDPLLSQDNNHNARARGEPTWPHDPEASTSGCAINQIGGTQLDEDRGDVDEHPIEVPGYIRSLLDNRTYLEWNDKKKQAESLFWKKLVKHLYAESNDERCCCC